MKIWRVNTGKAVGYNTIKNVLRMFREGQFKEGVNTLRTARVITFGTPGQADIQGLTSKGRFLAIEVKSATGRQDEDQKAWGEMILKKGGIYIIARSEIEAEHLLRLNDAL